MDELLVFLKLSGYEIKDYIFDKDINNQVMLKYLVEKENSNIKRLFICQNYIGFSMDVTLINNYSFMVQFDNIESLKKEIYILTDSDTTLNTIKNLLTNNNIDYWD